MTEKGKSTKIFRLLGIEGGGTHTTAVYKVGKKIETATFGTGNIYLLTEEKLRNLFMQIHSRFPEADCVVAGMAGARNESDFQRINTILNSLWKDAECLGTNDLEVGIANKGYKEDAPKILLVAGTGSCAYGKTPNGKTLKVGAWGHILGDSGSAYDAGLTALKFIAKDFDRLGKLSPLGEKVINSLSLSSPDNLVEWAKTATKSDIAGIAKLVFEMADKKDAIAMKVIKHILDALTELTVVCTERLLGNKRQYVEILLNGGIFEHNKWFVNLFAENISKHLPKAAIKNIAGKSYLGAIELAKIHYKAMPSGQTKSQEKPSEPILNKKEQLFPQDGNALNSISAYLPTSIALSPTELPNPLSKDLDKMPIEDAVRLFLQEDKKIPDAILPFVEEIALAIEMIADSFNRGGRLIYVGAGTSGRIAMLDAAECPPTFGVEPEMVQAIIAGGKEALQRSIEGAEDDFISGQSEIYGRNVNPRDFVLGIAASGTTRFVWGALSAAHEKGAKTMLLCFNPNLKMPSAFRPEIVICANTGAELLTGSTRLKAGTATKMILNIISTLSMARIGRVKGNLMLRMLPTNEKLRRRAIRIVCQAGNVSPEIAKDLLEKSNWDIQSAIDQAIRLAR